jgi:methionyl-tRNA synthetase
VDARKISKSAPETSTGSNDPVELASRYGIDALRWWLLREVPRTGDSDFSVDRLVARANEDLANGLGNLIHRVVSLAHSYRNGKVRACGRPHGTSRFLAAAAAAGGRRGPQAQLPDPAWPDDAAALLAAVERAPEAVSEALVVFDFRTAAAAVFGIVAEANRYVEAAKPWQLANAERAGDGAAGRRLDAVLGALVAACQVLAAEIWPFLPDLAARVAAACDDSGGRLPEPSPVFPRIETGQGYPAVTPTTRRGAREVA